MRIKLKGINTVSAKAADGRRVTYYYHRASGKRLKGKPGSAEFVASLTAAANENRLGNTLSGIIKDFEKTKKWRKLAESTKAEYTRVFKFWDAKFGKVPKAGLESKAFRRDVLKWHDEFSAEHPREADNRVTILARVLSWAAKDSDLNVNVLDGFDRAYKGDRSEMIWLPEHVDAFMAKADPEMQLALVLALHTGQRQADLLKLAWSNYNGTHISLRQNKARRDGKEGRLVTVRCTKALKETLDGIQKRGAVILTTKTGLAFKKRYFATRWAAVCEAAKITVDGEEKTLASVGLHFHDLRGTAVTMLFAGGCNVGEVASVTGHSLKRAQEILDKYLARTSTMADNAIAKFENVLETDSAKNLQKAN
jgi:integrase